MPIYIGSLGSGFINSFLAARRLRMQEEWYRTMREYYQSLMNKQGGAQTEFNKGAGPLYHGGFGAGGSAVTGKFWTPENQKHAYEYLMSTGRFSEYGAAGAVARMTREAPDGPTSENPKSHAFGIAQWLGDRLTPIKGNTDFDDQLKYYAGADLDRPEQARAKEQFKNASTAEEGSYAAMHMERAEGYQESGGRTDTLLHSTPTDSVYATVHGKEGDTSVVTGKVSEEKSGRVEKVSAKPVDIKAGWGKIINPKTPEEDKAAEVYKKQNPDWMKQYNAGKPPVVLTTAKAPELAPKPTPTTDSAGPLKGKDIDKIFTPSREPPPDVAQAQPFKPYNVAGPMEPPPTQAQQTGDVRTPPPQTTVQPFDPYWRSNPPLSSLQKVQAQDQPTTPAQGIPVPKTTDTTQPAQPKVPDEPRMKIQDQTQMAQQGIPPPPPPPGGGGEEASQDTRLVLPDMPQNPPVAQTQDPFAGQTPAAIPPGPTGQPLIRPQGTPQDQDQGQDQGQDVADVLGSAKGGPVLKFARGGVVQKFQYGGQATPPAYSITGNPLSEGAQVRQQMNNLIPLSPTSTATSIQTAYNALTPQQQQWYTQAGQDIGQVAALPLDVRASMGNTIYNQLGLPPAGSPAAAAAPAAAPAATSATTPATAPATVTPATTAVNVPGGDTTSSGATTGLIPWTTGQSGTITAPNTSSIDQTPFGQPSSNASDYSFTNTQNPSGTSYDVGQYGYLTNTAGYQFGGNVSPAALGAPPGMPMGGQGQAPIPPVYFNPATYSPYGAGVGKGVSYASAPAMVAQGVPTYQYGGDVGGDTGGDAVDQDIAQQMRYTPTPDQPTTDSGGTEPIQPIQVASIDSGVHIPSLGTGGGMGMRGPSMRRPPLPRQGGKSQDEGIHGYQDEPGPDLTPQKPQGAPPEAPMITDGQGNPSNGVTSAIAGALHFLGNALGIGPGQNNGALATDPAIQQNRRTYMPGGGGAASADQVQAIHDMVDPDRALDDGMRNLAGLEAVYKYYMLNSNPDAANRTAASMLMYSRDLAARYGDQAIAHYKSGDINSAIEALSKADSYIPNGLKMSGQLDPKTGQVDVEQRDMNNKLIWKQQVAPQAILAAALGVSNGQFFWGQLEQAAYKYDPVSQQMVDQRKIEQQAAALESAGKAMGGGAGGSGGPPSGEPGQGAVRPIQWKIPGQNAPVTAQGAPNAGQGPVAQAQPTTGSGAGPAIPNAPTGQAIPPPANLSPVVAQQNAQPVAPGASPVDSGTAPSPDGTASAVAQQPKSIDPNAPSPQAQDVSEEQEQSVYADIAAQAHSYNFTKDGVPLINGQPFTRPVEPSYAGMDKDTAARVKEMYKERLADYNSAVKFASSNEREMINSANRDASADITERRMRYRSEQSDLRQRTTMEQQEKLQTERMTQQEKMQTAREQFSQGQQTQRTVLQAQLDEHNKDYAANLKDTEPRSDKDMYETLGVTDSGALTTKLTSLLANAATPNLDPKTDPQVALQNQGFDAGQQRMLVNTLSDSITHSPHVRPEAVADAVMKVANGEPGQFKAERVDKDGKPQAGPYGMRYAVTVNGPTGPVSFTMLAQDFLAARNMGQAKIQADANRQGAEMVRPGRQFPSWPTPPRGQGIPTRGALPIPAPQAARPMIIPRPGDQPLLQRRWVPNQQVPPEWRKQFPELNQ